MHLMNFKHFSRLFPHFGVRTTLPITNLEFTVTDCNVFSDSDTQSADTKHYAIMKDKCPNTRINFQIYQGSDNSLTTFSYKVFEFKRGAENSLLHLICSVVVCDSGDLESVCKEPGSDCDSNRGQRRKKSRRRTRGLSDDKGVMYYQVSRSFGYV